MKKSLLLVVALLSLSGLMAAMAFTSATVTSAGSILISSTNEALLAVGHAGTDQDKIVHIEDGEAIFDFGRGLGGVMRGFQPNSEYFYNAFMHTKNLSNNPVRVEISLEGFGNAKDYITIKHNGNGTVMVQNGVSTGNSILMDPGNTKNFGLLIEVPAGVNLRQVKGKVIVHAERVEGATGNR